MKWKKIVGKLRSLFTQSKLREGWAFSFCKLEKTLERQTRQSYPMKLLRKKLSVWCEARWSNASKICMIEGVHKKLSETKSERNWQPKQTKRQLNHMLCLRLKIEVLQNIIHKTVNRKCFALYFFTRIIDRHLLNTTKIAKLVFLVSKLHEGCLRLVCVKPKKMTKLPKSCKICKI